jgi:hypothetical protein
VAIPTAILVAPAPGDWPAISSARRATRRRATANKSVPESEVRQREPLTHPSRANRA